MEMNKFILLIGDYVPYNKHQRQVKSGFCELSVKDYDGSKTNKNPWLEITLRETYTPEGSARALTRTISVTLDKDQRADLLAILSANQDAIA